MKVLIWVSCFFVFTLLNEIIGYAIGIKAGYLVLYLVCAAAAKALCNKWNNRQGNTQDTKPKKSKPAAEPAVSKAVPVADSPTAQKLAMMNPSPVHTPPAQPRQNVHPEQIVLGETDRKELKRRTVGYLPKDLEQTGAQREIIRMLAVSISTIDPCVEKAEREIWPKVERNDLPIKHAVAQCGNEIDKLIGITIIENLKLESKSEENLLKAWIALDYYAHLLKPEYCRNIRDLQNRIAMILKARKTI